MNTMKFYKTKRTRGGGRELLTLRVKIDQRVGHYNNVEQRGQSRAEACAQARREGFYRMKREAVSA